MARNYRKERGRATEHLVAQAFAADGWPHAEATGAGTPGRDIKGVPGVACEVKARNGFEPLTALRQAVGYAAGDVPVVVMRPNGCGPTTIDDWPAFLPFGVLRSLLRQAGYGDPTAPASTLAAQNPEVAPVATPEPPGRRCAVCGSSRRPRVQPVPTGPVYCVSDCVLRPEPGEAAD